MSRRSMMRHRLGGRGDAGQVPTVVMMIVFLGLLMVIFSVAVPFGQASDLKAGSQSAADAAALAAAEQMKDDFPGALQGTIAGMRSRDDLQNLLVFLNGLYGYAGASEYAGRNDADVQEYRFDRFGGAGPGNAQIKVRVEGRATADESTGGRATSTAYAKLGFRLSPCVLTDDDPRPTPTPSPTPPDDDDADPSPPPPPPPPPNTGTEVRCGDLALHFTVNGQSGTPTLDLDPGRLKDLIDDLFEHPALTG